LKRYKRPDDKLWKSLSCPIIKELLSDLALCQPGVSMKFYEFFAGGGMARAGLGSGWDCLFANDFDLKKGSIYQKNWGHDALHIGDVKKVEASTLPGLPDLVWGSFPCQDLSLAGGGAGLKGERSGTFWPFWSVIKALSKSQRAPQVVALENVCGALTSHEGKDFSAICSALDQEGYVFGALVIDAAFFVPQSRPRLFVIGYKGTEAPPDLVSSNATNWHTPGLRAAYARLPAKVKKNWVWWKLPSAPARTSIFSDLIEENPIGVNWHSPAATRELLAMMSEANKKKVQAAKALNRKVVGAIYKRTRVENSIKVQRAEVRFDDIAGCLRTPAGGSSRQLIMVVEGRFVRSRLISTRETARLMGLPDTYTLPEAYNEAYHLTGDGVVVPVVRFLAHNLLEPLVCSDRIGTSKAAA
jgi:DNA (cytosine-5)-methyltransferase 1